MTILNVDKVTRIVAEKFCERMRIEDEENIRDDYGKSTKMGKKYRYGFDDAIKTIRQEAGLELFYIDYESYEIIETIRQEAGLELIEQKNNHQKKTTRKPEVFTVNDEKVFTVNDKDIESLFTTKFTVKNGSIRYKSSEIKIMGEVVKGERYIEDMKNTIVCDECQGHFNGSEIELKPFDKNFGRMVNSMMPFNLIDATVGEIIGTGALNKYHDYYTMCCPICHKTYLWGMISIDPRKIFEVK